MTLGYVMNSYPMVSTTFIGREIKALEAQGDTVRRYAIRPWGGPLSDPDDLHERDITQYLLTGPRAALASGALRGFLKAPGAALRGLRLALKLNRAARGGALPRLVRHIAYWLEALALAHYADRDGITHLHAHFSSNATTVALLTQTMGGPGYSFTLHGPTDLFSPHEDSLRDKIASARFVACISHFARAQAMFFSDLTHWDRLKIVHCGVDPARYDAPRGAEGGKRLLFVGRIDAIKGVPLLVDAMAALTDHPDAHLTVIGDGTHKGLCEDRARDLGVADQITFAGFQDQDAVAAELARTDVFVLPSFAEGVPVVLMEAMAARVPVIASRVAGVGELVEDGTSGITIPAGDLNSLVSALNRLLADADLRQRMGQAGRAKVVEEFDVLAEAAWLQELFAGAQSGQLPATLRPVR